MSDLEERLVDCLAEETAVLNPNDAEALAKVIMENVINPFLEDNKLR